MVDTDNTEYDILKKLEGMHQNLANRRVLIVEDDAEIAKLLKFFFSEHNLESVIAKNGVKAEEFFKKGKYSLIITDVIFFQSGGIDFINIVRQSDKIIPIIVMTGFGLEVAKEAMKAGANDYILKPFNFLQLSEKIGKYIGIYSYEKHFGTVAVENGFITPGQLSGALKIQVMEDVEIGKHRPLGIILLEQKLITISQIEEVVKIIQDNLF